MTEMMPENQREQDQQQAQAVKAEFEADAEMRDPWDIDEGDPCSAAGNVDRGMVRLPAPARVRAGRAPGLRARSSAALNVAQRAAGQARMPPMAGSAMSQMRASSQHRDGDGDNRPGGQPAGIPADLAGLRLLKRRCSAAA